MSKTEYSGSTGGSPNFLENCLVAFRLEPSRYHSFSAARKLKIDEIKYTWDVKSQGALSNLTILESDYFPEDLVLVKTNSLDHTSLVNFVRGAPAERSSILHFQHSFQCGCIGKEECCVDAKGNKLESLSSAALKPLESGINHGKVREIIVAILDTGIDPDLIPAEYLWINPDYSEPSVPLSDTTSGIHGRNFIADTTPNTEIKEDVKVLGDPENRNIRDDHPQLHGTLMAAYIINQFRHSEYAIKIMPLKTHNKEGLGDLADIYRAIHYAKHYGAHFINASWAFPATDPESYSILKDVIQRDLGASGTLLVTVSGNVYPDQSIQKYYPAKFGKRSEHPFMGVLVAATVSADKTNVSPAEASSNLYVDFGVPCDQEIGGKYLFDLPLATRSGDPCYQQGSSVACAIATGFLAATLPGTLFEHKPSRSKLGLLEYADASSFAVYPELNDGIIGGRVLNLIKGGNSA